MDSVNRLVKMKKLFNRSGRREIQEDAQGETDKNHLQYVIQDFLFVHYGEMN